MIGIHAVDSRGIAFKGGGRVVKNVAGYDFCKLLTGSLGTLGVITQLALKVKPIPEQSAAVVAECADLDSADSILNRLAQMEVSPVAIDLLVGAAWKDGVEACGELSRADDSARGASTGSSKNGSGNTYTIVVRV